MPVTEPDLAAIGATGCAVAWADHFIGFAYGDHSEVNRARAIPVVRDALAPLLNGAAKAEAIRLFDYRFAVLKASALIARLKAGDGVSDTDLDNLARLLDRARAHDCTPQ